MQKFHYKNITKSLNKWIKSPILHPIIFATFPVMTVISTHFDQIELSKVYRPFLVLYLLLLVLFSILYILNRDLNKAGFITSVIFILFFYVHYVDVLPKNINLLTVNIHRNWIYLSIWVAIIYLFNSKIFWSRIRPELLTNFFNITAIFLILLPIARLTKKTITHYKEPLRTWARSFPAEINPTSIKQTEKPDIYYIILDGYAREDVLEELYGYDNRIFLDFLKNNGFYVAEKSQSNYTQTALSIASSLNMTYLDFVPDDAIESNNRDLLKNLIQDSNLQHFLQNQGYQTIAFTSGYYVTENPDADIYLTPFKFQPTNIESLLFNRSPAKIISDIVNLDLNFDDFDTHHNRVLFSINELGNIPSRETNKPKFIFAHIIAPHPPFVFDQNGNLIEEDQVFTFDDIYIVYGSPQGYITKYSNQLTYINKILMKTIGKILSDSIIDPIIILQADHGPAAYFNPFSIEISCAAERFSIFNAYYFPEGNQENLYDTITPINSFRILLDQFFHTELGVLEDKSYFSSWLTPYKLIEMESPVQLPCNIN